MKPLITKADYEDLPFIYKLYEEAIQFQKNNHYQGWDSVDHEFLKADISNGLLYKIIKDDAIIAIFSVCFSDLLIWRNKEKGDAIYLHRIALNRIFREEKVFKIVLAWAKEYAIAHQLKFIRIDTWANNVKLIAYYKSYGFSFVERFTTSDSALLPVQHRNLKVALLEYEIVKSGKVNIDHELIAIDKYWTQRVIGEVNGQLIKLAKGIGELNWHQHDDQDELFIVFKGHLTIQLDGRSVELYSREMFIVPKGVQHCPRANEEVHFLIMGLNITSNAAGGKPENRSYEITGYQSTE